MNVEATRLETFNDWPSNAAVSSTRMARAGFFYTKQNTTVECFSCHIKISDWSIGDQAMAKHRSVSPTCSFVINPLSSGNVTNITANSDNLEDETNRLRSYANWPIPHTVRPKKLAQAGFIYLGREDMTKCVYCRGIVSAWELGDDPDAEHKRLFPECPFVLSTIAPRLLEQLRNTPGDRPNSHIDFPNINLVQDGNLAELGVHTHKGPKQPRYGTIEARLGTFTNWPVDLIQTPDVLAQAGFYYEGSGDQVRCFHCDGGLEHWEPHDEPWAEHARRFPNCGFVLLLKGQDFVLACSPEREAIGKLELPIRKPAPHRKEVTDREIQQHMALQPALAALNIGLHFGRVKQAIKEKLERTGVGFSTEDALIEATLNLQREEEDTVADTQISRSVTNMLSNVLKRSLQDARAEQSENMATENDLKPLTLEEENRQLREARLCKICMDNEVGIVFLPCGHFATCINCAPNLKDCPVCRSAIKATVRTFLS